METSFTQRSVIQETPEIKSSLLGLRDVAIHTVFRIAAGLRPSQ
jgi:hypothetical protein